MMAQRQDRTRPQLEEGRERLRVKHLGAGEKAVQPQVWGRSEPLAPETFRGTQRSEGSQRGLGTRAGAGLVRDGRGPPPADLLGAGPGPGQLCTPRAQ